MPAPPDDWNLAHWLGFIIMALIASGAFLLMHRLSSSNTPNGPAPSIELETPEGQPNRSVNMAGWSPNVAEGFAANAAVLNELFRENAKHEERIGKLEAANETLKDDQAHLVAEIVHIREGVENGTIPPLPEMSKRIAHLFNPAL